MLSVCLIATVASAAATTRPAARPTTGPTMGVSDASGVETIVIMRHAEKPPGGLGQLSPQGLNRALALSDVLPRKFGKPAFLFAPDPGEKEGGGKIKYYYVRPLETIEPTAIKLGMPVNTPVGYSHIAELENELIKPAYANALVFLAWEHFYAQKISADLVKAAGGNPANVPSWDAKDFDSLFVVKITRVAGQKPTVEFIHDHEDLNNQSTSMPNPAQ